MADSSLKAHTRSVLSQRACVALKENGANMVSNTPKPRTYADTIHGRPTLKDVDCFRKGSARELYDRSLYERTFMSKLNENSCYHSNLNNK